MEPRGIRWSPEQFVEDRQVVVQRPYRREPRKGRVTEETAKSGQTDGGPEGLDRDTATMELECEAAVVGAKAAVRFREVFERRADRGDVGARREGCAHEVVGGRGFWRAAASCSLSRTR